MNEVIAFSNEQEVDRAVMIPLMGYNTDYYQQLFNTRIGLGNWDTLKMYNASTQEVTILV
jgi:hypothetical protein